MFRPRFCPFFVLLSALSSGCGSPGPSSTTAPSSTMPVVASSFDAGTGDDAGTASENAPGIPIHGGAGGPVALSAKDSLVLNHGPCYGKCKELTLRLAGDGTFTGRGPAKRLDDETTRGLFAEAARAFEPPPRCPEMPTDLQRVTITLVQGGTEHKAVYVHMAPCSKELEALEKRLLAIE